MILFRPVSVAELKLIFQTGMTSFPPRLPEQPIFYPVVEEAYARKIAEGWNATPKSVGFVTRFEVEDDFVKRYPVQQAGGRTHTELWVPAEELAEFNQHLLGVIEVIGVYCGEGYRFGADGSLFADYLQDLLIVSHLEGWNDTPPGP